MPKPLDYVPVIEKLLRKSEEGRVDWKKDGEEFSCLIGEPPRLMPCYFRIRIVDDTYQLRMVSEQYDEIFSVSSYKKVFFEKDEEKRLFEMLRDIYEFARRKALKVEDRLQEASNVLDQL